MSPDSSPQKKSLIPDPPSWLKKLSEWNKVVPLLLLIAGVPASFFLGPIKGAILAGLIVGFGVALYVVLTIVKNAGVAESRGFTIFWTIVLSLATTVSLAWLLAPPVYHALSTKIPGNIAFASVIYFAAGQASLMQSWPVTEAVITSLKDEGLASGMRTRIILGITKPFENPTPAFRLQIRITDDNFQLSAYASSFVKVKPARGISRFCRTTVSLACPRNS